MASERIEIMEAFAAANPGMQDVVRLLEQVIAARIPVPLAW